MEQRDDSWYEEAIKEMRRNWLNDPEFWLERFGYAKPVGLMYPGEEKEVNALVKKNRGRGFAIVTRPYFTFATRNRICWAWEVYDIVNVNHEDAVLLHWSSQDSFAKEYDAIKDADKFIDDLLAKEEIAKRKQEAN